MIDKKALATAYQTGYIVSNRTDITNSYYKYCERIKLPYVAVYKKIKNSMIVIDMWTTDYNFTQNMIDIFHKDLMVEYVKQFKKVSKLRRVEYTFGKDRFSIYDFPNVLVNSLIKDLIYLMQQPENTYKINT